MFKQKFKTTSLLKVTSPEKEIDKVNLGRISVGMGSWIAAE